MTGERAKATPEKKTATSFKKEVKYTKI